MAEEALKLCAELYEPFKTIIIGADLECLKRTVKPRIRQKNAECAYSRMADRWLWWLGMALEVLRKISALE